MSTLITAHHLRRKAVIYIRQSTPNQVLTHQESVRLQYALKERALALGWHPDDIEVIDRDLGLSAQLATNREGFKTLLSQVALGEVGLILAFEVTRLCRNCSDWYPLLDICGYTGCLIADTDGVYDPGTPNGRLLLGLKGQLSELELHTIRSRLTAGLLNKARRGELALALPMGLVRDSLGRVHKDPNQEVQDRIALVFSTFLKQGSASKVVRSFNEHQLQLPRRDRFKDLIWKRPTVPAVLSILKNPAYAGAFVYGRTRHRRSRDGKRHVKRLPIEEWKIVIQDKYPAYITWQSYEKIQAMVKDNYAEYDRNKTRGVPRAGTALLHGLVYCGACGHKMVVQYKGGTRYLCNYLRQQYQVPVCQNIPGTPVDAHVVAAFFKALSPIELDALKQALALQAQEAEQVDRVRRQQLQRLRYEAELARRQYQHVDPENRLVATELERRWELALRQLQQAEAAYERAQHTRPDSGLPPEMEAAFSAIGEKLPQIWEDIPDRQKKAFLRALIDKVVVHRQPRDQLQCRLVWKGGAVTEMAIPIPVGAFSDLCFAEEMERQILEMARAGDRDEAIAAVLTERGYRSPQRGYVLPSTVRSIRLKHGLMLKRSQSHPRHIEGALTLPQIARQLGVRPHWIYDRINKGAIEVTKDPRRGLYLFPDTDETLEAFEQFKRGERTRLSFPALTA